MSGEPQVVWKSELDGRYDVRVLRKSDYTGDLVVSDGAEELHREEVTLSYGAIFGPDVADVAAWCDKACWVIDTRDGTELRHRAGSSENDT